MRYTTLLSAVFPALVIGTGTRGHLAKQLPIQPSRTQSDRVPAPSDTSLPGWWDIGPNDSKEIWITDNVQYQYMVTYWLVDSCMVTITCADGKAYGYAEQHWTSQNPTTVPVCSEAGNFVVRINALCN